MQHYRVRLFDATSGSITSEVHEAQNKSELREFLLSKGAMPLTIRRTPNWKAIWRARGRPSYTLFCRELRTLIQAGMTVVEAVDTLSAKERQAGKAVSLAAQLLGHLEHGKALSIALEMTENAPSVLVAAVRAGERTSDLVSALDDYLRFDALMTELRTKVVSAAIYPGLVTALGVGISAFLLLFVMPSFASMYGQVRGEAEGAVGVMIGLSLWIKQHQASTLIFIVGLLLAFGVWVWSGKAAKNIKAVAIRIPWIKSRIEDFQLAMLYQALALMLRGGYPMTEALRVASRSALDAQLGSALNRALNRIEQGEPVARSLVEAGLCDEVGRRLMAAAERNGDFHLAADVVSRLHGERFELFVERLTRIVEPVLLMGVALMVGGIVVMMYLPVFDVATRLK